LAAWKVPPEAEPYDQDEADGVIVAVLVVTNHLSEFVCAI
jgi:hypothetical protein